MIPKWEPIYPDEHLLSVSEHKFEHIVCILTEGGSGAWIPHSLTVPYSEITMTMDIMKKGPIHLNHGYTEVEKTALYYLTAMYLPHEVFSNDEIRRLLSNFGNSHINCKKINYSI